MTNENRENFPKQAGDLTRDIIRIESGRAINLVHKIFKERYEKFKNQNVRSIDLYAGDFRPQIGFTSTYPLQIMLPSHIFLAVNYEEFYASFVKIFSKDMITGDLELGSGFEIPEQKTENLKKIVIDNPGKQFHFSYLKFGLAPSNFYEKRIEVKRYFGDFHFNNAIAEFWSAGRYSKS